jgi:uncharacterized protein (TIGR00369 family)
LNQQPNSRHCFVCGLENANGLGLRFYDNGEEEVIAHYSVPDHFEGYPGTVHGGIVASMLDEVVGRTRMIKDPDHFTVSAKLTIRYRKPIPIGAPLKMVGRIVRDRGRSMVAKAELWLPDSTIGAEAEAILIDAPDFSTDTTDFEALGWKIYPEANGETAKN